MPAILNEHDQWTDLSGKPIVNGYVYFGVQGADPTVSPITIYSDRELTTVITNPQRTDAYGRTINKVWVAGRYSIRIGDPDLDAQLYINLDNGETADKGITVLEDVSGGNAIIATAASIITAYEDLEQYTFRTAQVNTGAVTLNIDTVGAKPIVKNHDQPILAEDFEADQNVVVSYNLTDDVFEWVNQNVKTVTFYEGSSVASAATTNIWSTDGNTLHVTGVATITSLGTAPNVGAWRKVIFDGALTLTDGASLQLPGGANITTAGNDFAFVYAETATLFKVLYFKADGTAVAAVEELPTGYINGLETYNDANDLLHDISVKRGTCRDSTDTEDMEISVTFIRKLLDAPWAVGGAAGGLDTGSIAADTWYYIWVIKRTDTGVVDALFSLSSTAPTMPANYDKKRLIWAVKTKAAATEIELYTQTGNYCEWWSVKEDYNGVGVIAGALITVTVPILPVIAEMQGYCLLVGTSYHTLHSTDHENVAAGASNFDYVTFGSASVGALNKPIPASAGQVRHRDSTTTNIEIRTNGWTLNRSNI